MAITSARAIVSLKEKGHFQPEDARIVKYTLADELPAKISELVLRPRPRATPDYTIRKLTPDDKDATIKFLDRFFFRDEPMNKAVKLLDSLEARCIELEDYAAATLDDLVSLAAVDEKGEFVGVIINGIVRREDALNQDKDEECANEKFARILRVLDHLNKQAKIWEVLPPTCNSVLEIRIASTHTAWRGRGLMTALTEETERLAHEHGATAIRMDATSAFSAAAAERLGFQGIYSVKYADLPGAPQPEAPHLEARVYIKPF